MAKQVPHGGYCQPGMIMATVGAIKAGHHGNSIGSQVKNICICGTYACIKAAMAAL